MIQDVLELRRWRSDLNSVLSDSAMLRDGLLKGGQFIALLPILPMATVLSALSPTAGVKDRNVRFRRVTPS